jgi:hypothetical protein
MVGTFRPLLTDTPTKSLKPELITEMFVIDLKTTDTAVTNCSSLLGTFGIVEAKFLGG